MGMTLPEIETVGLGSCDTQNNCQNGSRFRIKTTSEFTGEVVRHRVRALLSSNFPLDSPTPQYILVGMLRSPINRGSRERLLQAALGSQLNEGDAFKLKRVASYAACTYQPVGTDNGCSGIKNRIIVTDRNLVPM
jgi:hypothetical protein